MVFDHTKKTLHEACGFSIEEATGILQDSVDKTQSGDCSTLEFLEHLNSTRNKWELLFIIGVLIESFNKELESLNNQNEKKETT